MSTEEFFNRVGLSDITLSWPESDVPTTKADNLEPNIEYGATEQAQLGGQHLNEPLIDPPKVLRIDQLLVEALIRKQQDLGLTINLMLDQVEVLDQRLNRIGKERLDALAESIKEFQAAKENRETAEMFSWIGMGLFTFSTGFLVMAGGLSSTVGFAALFATIGLQVDMMTGSHFLLSLSQGEPVVQLAMVVGISAAFYFLSSPSGMMVLNKAPSLLSQGMKSSNQLLPAIKRGLEGAWNSVRNSNFRFWSERALVWVEFSEAAVSIGEHASGIAASININKFQHLEADATKIESEQEKIASLSKLLNEALAYLIEKLSTALEVMSEALSLIFAKKVIVQSI